MGGGWDGRTPWPESAAKLSTVEVLGWGVEGKQNWLATEEHLGLRVLEDGA